MTIDAIMNPRTPSKAELLSALKLTVAVTEVIREAGRNGIPSGHLYALLLDRVTLQGYESMIAQIKRTGLVEERGNVLYWTGPEFQKEATR
jgi:hypothetical protein